MRPTNWLVAILSLGLTMAACSPRIAGSSPGSITFENLYKSRIDDAYQMAQDHCAKYGKSAQFVPDETPDGYGTFNCV